MMGRLSHDQEQFFYSFRLDEAVPDPEALTEARKFVMKLAKKRGIDETPAAISEAKVAVNHARLAERDPKNLEDMKLHAGHVTNALDPSVEPKGPGAGYGVKKAVAGALQHLDFAAKADGASAAVKTHAAHVSASLTDAAQSTDQAIALAQKIRTAASAAEAAPLVSNLIALTTQIVDGLSQSQTEMASMMKGEGILENMPR